MATKVSPAAAPEPAHSRVMAMVRSPALRLQLEVRLRGQHAVDCVTDADSLLAACADGDASAVFLEVGCDEATRVADAVRRVRRVCPDAPIVLDVHPRVGVASHIVSAIRAGASAIALHGIDDGPAEVLRALDEAPIRREVERTWDQIATMVPARLVPILHHHVHHIAEGLNVHGIARALGLHRRTLVYHFEAAAWPAPSPVLAYCRVLVAVRLLSTTSLAPGRVAAAVGLASAAALRALLRRMCDKDLSQARHIGFDGAFAQFEDFVHGARVAAGGDVVSVRSRRGNETGEPRARGVAHNDRALPILQLARPTAHADPMRAAADAAARPAVSTITHGGAS